MSFGLYSIGFVLVIAGLIYGAHLMHVPTHWIVVGAIVLLGLRYSDGCQSNPSKGPFELAVDSPASCRVAL